VAGAMITKFRQRASSMSRHRFRSDPQLRTPWPEAEGIAVTNSRLADFVIIAPATADFIAPSPPARRTIS